MLGALISYGVQPGPRLFAERPDVFWSVIVSMYLGNIVLLILNLPLIPYIARLLAVPKPFLVPFVLFFSLIGVYLVSFNNFDIYLMMGFAACALFSLSISEDRCCWTCIGDCLRNWACPVINDGDFFLWATSITAVHSPSSQRRATCLVHLKEKFRERP